MNQQTPHWKNNSWLYRPAVQTDVMKRFREFGFKPPTEIKRKNVKA